MILEQTGKLAPANEPWQLIRDAVHDLELQEKCEEILVDMEVWHSNNEIYQDGKCHQCLAGCVISRRLSTDTEVTAFPESFDDEIGSKLLALNSFRAGSVLVGLIDLGYKNIHYIDREIIPSHMYVPPYYINPAEFKKGLLAIAQLLEEKKDYINQYFPECIK